MKAYRYLISGEVFNYPDIKEQRAHEYEYMPDAMVMRNLLYGIEYEAEGIA